MSRWRHPFESAAAAAWPKPAALVAVNLRLDERDREWIRGLRPETAAAWATTLGSGLFSVLLYSALWHLPIASGLVLGMWVHELGHLLMLRRLGLPSAPIVFVPFVGAMIRVRERPERAADAALIALAGPAFGLLFAAACKLGFAVTGYPALRFLGTAHAILAAIDLLPFGMLDGARVAAVLTRKQRIACAAFTCALAIACRSMLFLPICGALTWIAAKPAPSRAEPWVLWLLMAEFVCVLCLV